MWKYMEVPSSSIQFQGEKQTFELQLSGNIRSMYTHVHGIIIYIHNYMSVCMCILSMHDYIHIRIRIVYCVRMKNIKIQSITQLYMII